MRLFYAALGAVVLLLSGCATAQTKSIFSERQYKANSRLVYNAVTEVLKQEQIPLSIVDTTEPRVIITEFVETKELNRYRRYRFRIVVAALSEELTAVEISSRRDYFDDFWRKQWLPIGPDKEAEEALFKKITDYLEPENNR